MDLRKQRRLTAEKMGAASQVDQQRIIPFLGHPRAKAARPATQRRQELCCAIRIGGAGDQIGAKRQGLGQRLAAR